MLKNTLYKKQPSGAANLRRKAERGIMKYAVYLIDECTGNEYEKYVSNHYFDCIVYINNHRYSCPKGCYYKIYEVGK